MAEGTTLGVTYTENNSTPYLDHSYDRLEDQEPRLLALGSLGKPGYVRTNDLLYKNDVEVKGTNGLVELGYGETSDLLKVTVNRESFTTLKVKMPAAQHYTTQISATGGSTSNTAKIKVDDKNGSSTVGDGSAINVKGTGSTEVSVNNGELVINSTNTTYSDFIKSGSTAAHGLVPRPDTTAGTSKFLCEDATWKVPSNATTSTAGFMSAADKTKLDGIATGANKYILPTANAQTLGGVKIGTDISISDGVISVVSEPTNSSNFANKIAKRNGSGDLYANAFFANSDAKLKTNITDVPKASISKIDKVKIHEFDWKDGGKHSVGVIAQDVKESGLDFLVKGESTLSVDYTSILLLKIASLEEKIKELESKIK